MKPTEIEIPFTLGHKMSKQTANYTTHSVSGEMCKNCRHFIRPNECDVVHGTISPEGWCKYFEE